MMILMLKIDDDDDNDDELLVLDKAEHCLGASTETIN